jgi:hypothetical protein
VSATVGAARWPAMSAPRTETVSSLIRQVIRETSDARTSFGALLIARPEPDEEPPQPEDEDLRRQLLIAQLVLIVGLLGVAAVAVVAFLR